MTVFKSAHLLKLIVKKAHFLLLVKNGYNMKCMVTILDIHFMTYVVYQTNWDRWLKANEKVGHSP